MKKLLSCMLAVLMLGFVACSDSREVKEDTNATQLLPGEEFKQDYNEDYNVETPYMVFTRSDVWGEDIAINHENKDGDMVYVFTSKVEEEDVLLFSLVFTEKQSEHHLLGTFTTDRGKNVSVYADVKTIERQPEWTDDQFDKLNLMQEYINDIIWQLNENSSFTPAGK